MTTVLETRALDKHFGGLHITRSVSLQLHAGERLALIDDFFPRQTYRLAEFAYAPDAPLRAEKPPAPAPLPRNPIAEPDLAGAERHRIEFGGEFARLLQRSRELSVNLLKPLVG